VFFYLNRDTCSIPEKQFRNAIATICIGDAYLYAWEAMCRKGWRRYCDSYGFDLIIVTDHLDDSERAHSRSPAWEKLLVLIQPWAQLYERIVWVDADIIISQDAPSILEEVPDPTKVGICLSGGQMSAAEQHIYFERLYKLKVPPSNGRRAWQFHHQSGFEKAGAAADTPMFNSGVLVLSPPHHAQLMRSIYDRDSDTRLYEQPFLSIELASRGLAEVISPRFNWSVHEVLQLSFREQPTQPVTERVLEQLLFVLRNEMNKAYFLHFAGSMPLMTLLYRLGIHSLEDDAVATPANAAMLARP
jgi:hypothetical protein